LARLQNLSGASSGVSSDAVSPGISDPTGTSESNSSSSLLEGPSPLSPLTADPLKSVVSQPYIADRNTQSLSLAEEKGSKHPRTESVDEKMDVDDNSESKPDGGAFKDLANSGSNSSVSSASSSTPSISDGALVVLIENVFNVRISIGSDGQTSEANSFPPELTSVKDVLSSWNAAIPVDFSNIVSAVCFEIVSRHIDGSLRDLQRIAGKESSSGPGSSSMSSEQVDAKDVASCLTIWFVDSLDRTYSEERKYPKVQQLHFC